MSKWISEKQTKDVIAMLGNSNFIIFSARVQNPLPKLQKYLFRSLFTRRRKLRIACDDFFSKSHPALTPLLLFSAKGHARLAVATNLLRVRGFRLHQQNAENIFFMRLRHVGAKSALLRLIFCLWKKNKPSAAPSVDPFAKSKSSALRFAPAILHGVVSRRRKVQYIFFIVL